MLVVCLQPNRIYLYTLWVQNLPKLAPNYSLKSRVRRLHIWLYIRKYSANYTHQSIRIILVILSNSMLSKTSFILLLLYQFVTHMFFISKVWSISSYMLKQVWAQFTLKGLALGFILTSLLVRRKQILLLSFSLWSISWVVNVLKFFGVKC